MLHLNIPVRGEIPDEKSSMKEDIRLALDEETMEEKPRVMAQLENPEERVLDFREVEKVLSREQAHEEAGRCLRCDLEVKEE